MALVVLLNLIFTLTLGFGLRKLLKIGHRPRDYPPGPPTLPILGNLHQLPKTKVHLQFQKWAEEYGPIYSLVLGTRTVIVLSSDQTIKDLLDRKGNIYSSRPDSYITDLATGGLSFAMMVCDPRRSDCTTADKVKKYNSTWKLCHRIFQNSINSRAAKLYLPFQDLENKQLLNDLVEDPNSYREHFRRYTHSLITQIVVGFRTASKSDPKLIRLYSDFEEWSTLIGKAMSVLVDLYPPLRHLPDFLLPVKHHAKKHHKLEKHMFMGYWNDIKAKMLSRTAPPCISYEIHKAQLEEEFSEDLACYICGFLLVAGSDTIATSLVVFVQAMLLYPEVQTAAQKEIDNICGNRIPSIEDPLPYIRACVKEVCRWMPSAILGVPHALTQDDEYMGYRIPKGSVVIMNVWSIHMDPKRHRNPRNFDPSRYLEDTKSMRESALLSNASERDHFLFGAGRRLCVGMDIAENSLFLSFARILWGFNILRAKNEDGSEVIPNPEDIIGGLAAYPRPFLASITPRDENRAQTIKSEWQASQSALDEENQWKTLPKDLPFEVNIDNV